MPSETEAVYPQLTIFEPIKLKASGLFVAIVLQTYNNERPDETVTAVSAALTVILATFKD